MKSEERLILTKQTAFRKFRKSPTFMFLCFCSLSIIGYLLFYAYPALRTLYLSFTDKKVGFDNYNFVYFNNFINIFLYETRLWKSLSNSFIYAFFSGAITLILALGSAMLLNSGVKGVSVFRVILFLPFVIPAFAAAAMFKGMFDPNNGIINTALMNIFGIQGPGWFKSESTALMTMILMSVWGFGVQMLIFLAALQNVPRELNEAAEIDGAGRASRFAHITLPMISNMLFLNVILVTIGGMKAFTPGFLIGSIEGNPNYSTLLYPVLIYANAFSGQMRLGYASALSWIFFAILLVLIGIQFIVSKFYVKNEV